MPTNTEKPGSALTRLLCAIGILGAAVGAAWLLLRIYRNPDETHTGEFIAVAVLAGLIIYLGWTLFVLSTAAYVLEEANLRLHLRQGLQRREINLLEDVRLYRWRTRWAWQGGLERDLGVTELELFPPLWFGTAWVLVYSTGEGGRRATAFCPSPELLARVRTWLREGKAQAG